MMLRSLALPTYATYVATKGAVEQQRKRAGFPICLRKDPAFFAEGRISILDTPCLLVIFRIQLRRYRRKSSEQAVSVVVDARGEEQRGTC
jgi:hypothetical protein